MQASILSQLHFWNHEAMVAEGYNGFHARFSKFVGEIFDCNCNVQLSTAIQLFNSDSLFQLPQPSRYFQNWVAVESWNCSWMLESQLSVEKLNCGWKLESQLSVETLNCNSNFQLRFQLSTAIPTFSRDSTFQRSRAIATFNCNSNFQPRFDFRVNAFSMSGFSCDRSM